MFQGIGVSERQSIKDHRVVRSEFFGKPRFGVGGASSSEVATFMQFPLPGTLCHPSRRSGRRLAVRINGNGRRTPPRDPPRLIDAPLDRRRVPAVPPRLNGRSVAVFSGPISSWTISVKQTSQRRGCRFLGASAQSVDSGIDARLQVDRSGIYKVIIHSASLYSLSGPYYSEPA